MEKETFFDKARNDIRKKEFKMKGLKIKEHNETSAKFYKQIKHF